MKIARIGSKLRFELQVELRSTGKRFDITHHRVLLPMMGFIVQKNILKINGEFKICLLSNWWIEYSFETSYLGGVEPAACSGRSAAQATSEMW